MRSRTREWPGSPVVLRGSFLRLVLSLIPLLGCASGVRFWGFRTATDRCRGRGGRDLPRARLWLRKGILDFRCDQVFQPSRALQWGQANPGDRDPDGIWRSHRRGTFGPSQSSSDQSRVWSIHRTGQRKSSPEGRWRIDQRNEKPRSLTGGDCHLEADGTGTGLA